MIIDHLKQALEGLDKLRVYRNSEQFKALLAPIMRDINRTEAMLEVLINWADLTAAVGIMLDRIGSLPWLDVERAPGM